MIGSAIIALAGVVLGALITSFVTYFLSRQQDRRVQDDAVRIALQLPLEMSAKPERR